MCEGDHRGHKSVGSLGAGLTDVFESRDVVLKEHLVLLTAESSLQLLEAILIHSNDHAWVA